ncbi:hypothetical protein AALO_G00154300 [Alosa alosa]|uniref:Growth hormone n=1 Tax=Alosa alosa TaxID=278164 RepID=A0AAV6GEU3_9TELE|nr:hypothetical protein AALO_G00154300 [Alosa alosa]
MAMISELFHVVLMTTVILQGAASQPLLNRIEEEVVDIDRRISQPSNCLLTGRALDSLTERSQGHPRRLPFHTGQLDNTEFYDRYARQLGDIEFSNRYAEYLRSKAKISSICTFLRRMQNAKKSGLGGDTEGVNTLLKQYMCPSVYQ